MKRVLTTVAMVLTLTLVLVFGSGAAFAAGHGGVSSPAGEVRPPADQNGSGGLNGQGGTTGDPDDLGGGFRSTTGTRKIEVKEALPPVTPFEKFLISAGLYWMTFISGR